MSAACPHCPPCHLTFRDLCPPLPHSKSVFLADTWTGENGQGGQCRYVDSWAAYDTLLMKNIDNI